MNVGAVFVTTFLASAVEAIELVTIVIGVGATRGWRSSLVGAAVGFVVLVVVVGGLGTALQLIPLDVLRLVIGALLLVFGLQWLRKAVRRVSLHGFSGSGEEDVEDGPGEAGALGIDWTTFVLSFKGVLLEGLEIAIIVVTFGSAAGNLTMAAIGGGSALVLLVLVGALSHRWVMRIPRSVLMLVVALALSTFGTFWAAEGAGVDWPGDDLALLGLVVFWSGVAGAFVVLLRREALCLSPETA